MTTMNRRANAHNIYQTDAKRVLCVCSAGLLRSPTLANVLHAEHGYNTRACGASPEYALVLLDDVLTEWADEVVFVDREAFNTAELFGWVGCDGQIVKVLNIPDSYEWNDPELKQACRAQYGV